jgi:hypothetical protein
MNKYMFSFLLTMTTTVFSAEDRALAVQAPKAVIAAVRQVSAVGRAPEGAAAVAASVSDASKDIDCADLFEKVAAISAALSDISKDIDYIGLLDQFTRFFGVMRLKNDLLLEANLLFEDCLEATSSGTILPCVLLKKLHLEASRIEQETGKRTSKELREQADRLKKIREMLTTEEDARKIDREQNFAKLPEVLKAKTEIELELISLSLGEKKEIKDLLKKLDPSKFNSLYPDEQVADGAAAAAKS